MHKDDFHTSTGREWVRAGHAGFLTAIKRQTRRRPQSHAAYCSALSFTLTQFFAAVTCLSSPGRQTQRRSPPSEAAKTNCCCFSLAASRVSTRISCGGECSFETSGKAQSAGCFPAKENVTYIQRTTRKCEKGLRMPIQEPQSGNIRARGKIYLAKYPTKWIVCWLTVAWMLN